MERKYSFLYSEIVEDENDMIGHIAYSLYKSNKIEYIKQFKQEHEDKNPDENDLEAFHKSSKVIIPALKIQAAQILTNFTELTLGETITEIEKEIREEQSNVLRQIIAPIVPKQKGYWDGFWMSVVVKGVQSIIVGLALFLIIFAASA